MCRILLLTKCCFAEQQIEQQIRLLGHEVFCTNSLLEMLMRGTVPQELLKEFQIVLLSDTITDKERGRVLLLLGNHVDLIIQKTDASFSEEELDKQKISGVKRFLSNEPSTETLREVLSVPNAMSTKSLNNRVVLMTKAIPYNEQELLENVSLSRLEKAVFHCLLEADGTVYSRDELCEMIWHSKPTNSNQSQLSGLIKRLRIKLEIAGLDGSCLKTLWGKGYILEKNLFPEMPGVETEVPALAAQ
ncbi:helix-turn-helix domain-containing protein [Enterococcus sp. 669A]|uniref:Helix-turn-helix domain-containing protein n=1 Tax=Candidatus Enterococcus moelleringii TaxID=2815325 RepID=A0ABS3L9Z4_9ENTE|nr:helix-turn-helix domain-containing protein [Enterococcus sp. 669A]MBO1306431.1 helix-turn-helix domain-containing protein [Enterococcus sp. 669A]